MNPNAQQIWMQENGIGYSQLGKEENSNPNTNSPTEKEDEISKAWKSVNLYE